jgi:outer membrane biosynthesis protein TonB
LKDPKDVSDEVSLKKTFIISILLHLLLLLVPLRLFMDSHSDQERIQQALAEEQQQDQMTFIFVDTPEDAAESPVEQVTPFISDKNLAASNTEAPRELTEGMPYQQGISEVAAMSPDPQPFTSQPGMPNSPQEQQIEQQQEQVVPEKQETGTLADPMRQLEALSKLEPKELEPEQQQQPQPYQQQMPSGQPGRPYIPSAPRFDNRQSRAAVGSDFNLSTYNWNWAPYLKELKKKVESNIYPPPAFYMGLIHGRTFLRFRIQKDGTLTDFELITYTGHETLRNTSVHSIQQSFPFIPLPSDFPEEYLEITAGFFYNEFLQ